MIFDLFHKIVCFGKNIFIFTINVIGATWNFIYKVFVPKKKRNFRRLYKHKDYAR